MERQEIPEDYTPEPRKPKIAVTCYIAKQANSGVHVDTKRYLCYTMTSEKCPQL